MKTISPSKLFIIFLLFSFTAKAQVGINILDPDTTAILHIHSDNKGVLLPIVDSAIRAPLTINNAPTADGLLVYDSIDKIYYFFNRKTREWLALNPFQVNETTHTNDTTGDVRLASRFENRNMVIGQGNADSNAKLHVKGNIKSDSTIFAKNADITGGRIDAKNAYISDSTWSKKIGSDSLNVLANANVGTLLARSNVDILGTLFARQNANITGDLSVSGNGKIGGFTINNNEIVGATSGNSVKVSANSLSSLGSLLIVTEQRINIDAKDSPQFSIIETRPPEVDNDVSPQPIQVNNQWHIGDFTLPERAQCWFNFSVIEDYDDPMMAGVISGLHNLVLQGPNGRQSISSTPIVLEHGTYSLIFEFNGSYDGTHINNPQLYMGAARYFKYRFDGGFYNEISKGAIFSTKGIALILDQYTYLYFSAEHGFEVRTGNHGIKSSNTGLQRMNSNGTWSNL